MSEPITFSTAIFLTSTGTSDTEVDATSESLPNAADASPIFFRVYTTDRVRHSGDFGRILGIGAPAH